MYIPKEQTPIAVVYSIGKGLKKYLKVFTDLQCPDRIIAAKSKKLPEGAEIHDIGVGKDFELFYKKKYKIK